MLRETIDWERLLRMAAPHGMLPLVYSHVSATCASEIPAPLLEELREQFQESSRRNLLLASELLKTLRLFEADGIPALAYKGPTLAALSYGNLALRHFADLDVLVQKNDLRRAAEILGRQGYRYRRQAPMTRVQEAVFRRFACELLFVRDDGRAKIDLHWGILPKMFAFPLEVRELWSRAAKTPLGGGSVFTLSPEDLLLVLCVHNSKHRWERLGWICDIAELIERQTIDWDQVFERARRLGSERMLRLGLFLASDLLRAKLPPRIFAATRADPVVISLARRAVDGLFAAADAPPHNVEDVGFYFRARERLRDKARFVVRAVTTPTANEVALVALPAALSFLYYVLRPLRLMTKYGRALWTTWRGRDEFAES
jgi:hypothetical protein